MLIDRNKCNYIIAVTCCCFIILLTRCQSNAHALASQEVNKNDGNGNANAIPHDVVVRNFSPRVDYNNEWRPVGRGDPLKNDPTYDYSPPTLDRVRYWAESSDKDGKKKEAAITTTTTTTSTSGGVAAEGSARKGSTAAKKSEILLLGVPSERVRGAHVQTAGGKNSKGEKPVLQPKYPSIRRSYYGHSAGGNANGNANINVHGHELPTRLMPPPMQTLSSAQHAMKPMMMATTMSEYRHNMPSYMSGSSSTVSGGGIAMATMTHSHPKSHYSTAATSPWMHHASSASPSSSSSSSPASTNAVRHYHHQPHHPMVISHSRASMPSAYDSRHQESVNYLSYTRPGVGSVQADFYSPNAIRHGHQTMKPAMGTRKPWLQELLQKEVVKTAKPLAVSFLSTKYPSMPSLPTRTENDFLPSMGPSGSTSTYAPVTFINSEPPTSMPMHPQTSTTSIYITSAATTPPSTTTAASMRPQYTTSTPAPTPTSSRLLIPTMSNLAHRPTVAPMEMTTDSLFSHYKQPHKPLLGPMYLIIEGHSKVKTYGKNDLDPHRPKIVPVISKREPVVRRADPNEKRGTLETFQVKHLHTKTTPVPAPSTAPAVTTTTEGPVYSTPKREETITIKEPGKMPEVSSDPPTGMQGLFSLLDSSLSSIFKDDEPLTAAGHSSGPQPLPEIPGPVPTTRSTILKPIGPAGDAPATPRPQLSARVSSKAESIHSSLDDDNNEDGEEEIDVTTETPPRGVRQVFDYDQLPESRLKEMLEGATGMVDAAYEDDEDDDGIEGEEEAEQQTESVDDDNEINNGVTKDEVTSGEDDEDGQDLIERIDKLVSSEVDDNDEGDNDDNDEEMDLEDLFSAAADAEAGINDFELRHRSTRSTA